MRAWNPKGKTIAGSKKALAAAREVGAIHAINSSNEEPVDAVKTLTRGGVQVSIDALGIGTTAWCVASAGPTR